MFTSTNLFTLFDSIPPKFQHTISRTRKTFCRFAKTIYEDSNAYNISDRWSDEEKPYVLAFAVLAAYIPFFLLNEVLFKVQGFPHTNTFIFLQYGFLCFTRLVSAVPPLAFIRSL